MGQLSSTLLSAYAAVIEDISLDATIYYNTITITLKLQRQIYLKIKDVLMLTGYFDIGFIAWITLQHFMTPMPDTTQFEINSFLGIIIIK